MLKPPPSVSLNFEKILVKIKKCLKPPSRLSVGHDSGEKFFQFRLCLAQVFGGIDEPGNSTNAWREKKPPVWRLCERHERVKNVINMGNKGKLCKFHLWIEPIELHHSFGLTVTFHACPT